MFESQGILNHREQEARYEISLETYTKKIQIESRIIADMVDNQIIPSALTYQKVLIDNVTGLKTIFSSTDYKYKRIDALVNIAYPRNKNYGKHFFDVEYSDFVENNAFLNVQETKAKDVINEFERNKIDWTLNQFEDAFLNRSKKGKVKPFFETIRYNVDKLENIVDDATWPLPKYREMLYLR